MLLAAACAVTLCWPIAFLAVGQPSGLSLTGLPPLSARPQEFVTLVFEARHQGASPVNVDFVLLAPSGFAPLDAPGTLTLDPGAEVLVFVTLLVPQNAVAEDHKVTLTMRLRDDPTQQAMATTIVRVRSTASLSLRMVGSQHTTPEGVVVMFVVTNEGNVDDHVKLQGSSQDGFLVRALPQQVELAPGQHAEIELRVQIPPETAARLRQTVVILSATSTAFPGTQTSASATINPLPPGPDQVDTQLAWPMPSQLTLSFARSHDPTKFAGLARFRGGGAFSQGHSLNVELAMDLALSVRTLAVGLETPWVGATVGDVKFAMGDLITLAGRGARLTLRSPLAASLSLAGVLDQPGRPLVGAFDLRLQRLHFGVGGVIGLAATLPEARFGTLLEAQPLPILSLGGQAAFRLKGEDVAHALRAQLRLRQNPLDLGLRYSQSTLGFPGQEAGQRLEFTQSLGLEHLVLQANVAVALDQFDSLLVATAHNRVQLVSRVFPGEGLPSLTGVFEYDTRRSALPPESIDVQAVSGSLSLFQPFPFASLGATVELKRVSDRLVPSDHGSLRMGAMAGWNAGVLAPSLRVAQVAELDFASGLATGATFEAEGVLGVRLGAGQLTLRIRQATPITELAASLTAAATTGVFQLALGATLDTGILSDYSIQMTFSRRFGLRVLLLPVFGQLQGRVYVDENNNGRADPGEGVGGIVLGGGAVRARSDSDGFFRFLPLPPGEVLVQPEQLPPELTTAVALPLKVTLVAGQRLSLALPLQRVAAVEGLVYSDDDGNGRHDVSEPGVPGVTVWLTGPDGQTHTTDSLTNGRFAFSGLVAGSYTLTLRELPPGLTATTETELPATLVVGNVFAATFGVRKTPREVRLTFAQPTAAFDIFPEMPTAGQNIVFDAGGSSDADGHIVRYEWDLDGDGAVDAMGQIVEAVYAAAGPVWVGLWVTDNDEAIGHVVRRVEVADP